MRSRVIPGSSVTIERRVPVRRLDVYKRQQKFFAKIEQHISLGDVRLYACARLNGWRRNTFGGGGFGDKEVSAEDGSASGEIGQMFPRASNGEPFFVKKALDFEDGFDVFAAV